MPMEKRDRMMTYDLIEKVLRTTRHDVTYWREEQGKGRTVPPFLETKHRQITLLEQERNILREKLDHL